MSFAQSKTNYDESKVGNYTLPDPLVTLAGRKIESAEEWRRTRRPEILNLFRKHVYGRNPDVPIKTGVLMSDEFTVGIQAQAIFRQIELEIRNEVGSHRVQLLLVMPAETQKPIPVFVSLNFAGNHSTHPDPRIRISQRWMPAGPGVKNNRATEESRGVQASRWPYEQIVSKGYAVLTAYYGDLEPDHPEGWKEGIRSFLSRRPKDEKVARFAEDDWGAIGAWTFGLSRMLDYVSLEPKLDAEKTIVLGHSRLGKTALWAGALEERFAMVISNNSGEGGAALSRRNFGETVADLNLRFPHWFCGMYKEYNTKVDSLPVDQHMLISLAAPRPVYIASAEDDKWADPKGEFLSGVHAEPVYQLFGKKGLGTASPPPVNTPIGYYIGYHCRTGRHDITEYDWLRFIEFAERHLNTNPKR